MFDYIKVYKYLKVFIDYDMIWEGIINYNYLCYNL